MDAYCYAQAIVDARMENLERRMDEVVQLLKGKGWSQAEEDLPHGVSLGEWM